ncbi:pro-resilin-like [Ochlerotatus camptorhynchus]|uniref:pro-resilin-like n=1 Tax=Ochlerotatus camptorhynchus TaxID=644619 RepID=UPI0031DBBFD3
MFRLSAVCVVLVLVGVSFAEPPASGGYPDRRNGNGNGGGGGGYQQVSSGQQTSEGQSVDPQLLDMVKMLLLQHESESSNGAGGGGGGSGGPYPSSNGGGSGGPYGSYGPPAGSSSQGGRVTGIELENPKQSMQVAEFWQGGEEQGAPSGQYGAPGQAQAPSGSYGAPSDSYGAPLGRK